MDRWDRLYAEVDRIEEDRRETARRQEQAQATGLAREARCHWITERLFRDLLAAARERGQQLGARTGLTVEAEPEARALPEGTRLHAVNLRLARTRVQIYCQRAFGELPAVHLSCALYRPGGGRVGRVVSFPGAQVELTGTTPHLRLLAPRPDDVDAPLDGLVYRAFELLVGGLRQDRSTASLLRPVPLAGT